MGYQLVSAPCMHAQLIYVSVAHNNDSGGRWGCNVITQILNAVRWNRDDAQNMRVSGAHVHRTARECICAIRT